MQIQGAVAIVTGANRGIGREFVRQLRERGATTVYATSRSGSIEPAPGIVPLTLDVTDPAQVEAAAAAAGDVTLVVNNAGVSTGAGLVDADLDLIRAELDTHLWGQLRMIRAFAPVLARNGGGAVLDVLSALSWRTYPGAGAYAVAKAAAWSMTDGVRLELAGQGTTVTGLVVGAVDTDMMAGYQGPMVTPAEVVAAALDGVEAGAPEVLADATARDAKASLSLPVADRYAGMGLTA